MHNLLGIRHGTGDKAWGLDDKPLKGLGGHQRTGPTKRKAPKNLKGLKLRKGRKRKRVV